MTRCPEVTTNLLQPFLAPSGYPNPLEPFNTPTLPRYGFGWLGYRRWTPVSSFHFPISVALVEQLQ